jgi:FtsP/CotA-like multicopper oxidase with cupredoxin domain
MLDTQVHGGESRTIVLTIPEDKEPGVNWYHDHVHGKTAHAYLSSLFGFIIVEGSTADLTAAQGVVGAREILMLLSEGLVNPDGSVPPVFPIAGQFNWTGVTNGNLGTDTEYQVTQGETVLFRVASATVEPTIRMSIPNMTFTVLAYDGLPLPEPFETDVVEVTGGSRVEFLAHFDTPGTFVMTRAAWTLFPNLAACTAGGFPFFPCISYDLEQEIATITVAADANNTAPTQSLNDTVVLPGYSQRLQDLAVQESVGEKTIHFQLNRGLPLFQIPYDGPFVPPGVGFGINDRFLSPHFIEGTVIAGTCETWTIISTPPNAEHPLHVHGAQFQVTAVDGMPLADPVWRDTAPISQNMAIHVCFDRMVGGEKFLVHCHMPSHLDIGMGAFFQTVPAAASETAPPTTTPATTTETPTTSPSAGAGRKLSALAALVVGTLSTMLLSGIM